MKKVILAGLLLTLAAGCSETKKSNVVAKGRNVNEALADLSVLKGSVALVGIMAGMSQDPSVFGIMDKQELKCRTANCDKVILPVRFKGKPPVRGDEVVVNGSFIKDVNGYIFNADTVQVVAHHDLLVKR